MAIATTTKSLDDSFKLDDLVSVVTLSDMSREVLGVGIDYFGVALPDGALFFCADPLTKETLSGFARQFQKLEKDDPIILKSKEIGIRVVPIVHEFERIGNLLVGVNRYGEFSREKLTHISDLLYKMINNHIRDTYKLKLASSIHSQVVSDTYAELRIQNDLLKKSEIQYKKLAESLDAEVKRKTEEIREANTQLMHQDKMASIGQLAAGVAHEINNPIGFIKSNLSTMMEYCSDLINLIRLYRKCVGQSVENVASSESIAVIHEIEAMEQKINPDYLIKDTLDLLNESLEGAFRVQKIVSDLKDFAHPGTETPSHADINACIDTTLNIIWNELKYKTTVVKEYGELPMLFCYPRQLNQVFVNVLVNAAQAIEKKGEIKIKTTPFENHLEIEISDTGAGIPEENLSKIFDPFFTTKEVGKGTGLGLNLSYNIIKKHKGEISVKSKVNSGTAFTIKLPYGNDL